MTASLAAADAASSTSRSPRCTTLRSKAMAPSTMHDHHRGRHQHQHAAALAHHRPTALEAVAEGSMSSGGWRSRRTRPVAADDGSEMAGTGWRTSTVHAHTPLEGASPSCATATADREGRGRARRARDERGLGRRPSGLAVGGLDVGARRLPRRGGHRDLGVDHRPGVGDEQRAHDEDEDAERQGLDATGEAVVGPPVDPGPSSWLLDADRMVRSISWSRASVESAEGQARVLDLHT